MRIASELVFSAPCEVHACQAPVTAKNRWWFAFLPRESCPRARFFSLEVRRQARGACNSSVEPDFIRRARFRKCKQSEVARALRTVSGRPPSGSHRTPIGLRRRRASRLGWRNEKRLSQPSGRGAVSSRCARREPLIAEHHAKSTADDGAFQVAKS